MSVTCPPTSKPGDTIQVMVPLPTGPPALLGLLEKESHVTFGHETRSAREICCEAQLSYECRRGCGNKEYDEGQP